MNIIHEGADNRPSAEPPTTPLAVLRRFRVLIRAAQRHSHWIEKHSGVTGAQLWAMQELAESPGLRVGDLAKHMALHQSTASNLIDKLETAGHLRKERLPADHRVVLLFLTEAGAALLATAPKPARGILPEALRRMDEAALLRLQQDLDTLLVRISRLDESFGIEPLPFSE
jgi:DNA-binding MarR family transcriptional regulator